MTHTNNRFCYACAASVATYTKYTLRDHGDIIDEESVNRYLSANVPQCLLCIAENMGNDISKNHLAARNFQKTFDYVVNNDFMKDSIVYLDSAGYQIQRGRILNEHLLDYAKDYHHFIQENAGRIGRAFTLDFSPSTDISVFSSIQEVYNLNFDAYQMAAALPEDLRDKMLAIMHFRGPNLYSTFRNLLFTDGFAHAFKRFSVGGLAVSGNVAQSLPCYPYTIPLADILKHALNRGMMTLQYHVLGNAERHDALMHCLVEKHVRATHGIDLKITHDASSAFKMPVQNRQVWIPDPARQSILDVSIKSQQIYIVSHGYGSAEEQVYGAINNAMVPYGMGPFNSTEHPFYVDRYPGVQKKYEDKKASTLGNFLPMMLMLNTYAQLDEWCEQATEQCYPYYEAGQKDDFEREIAKVIVRFGSRCDMAGARTVAKAITKSLDMLSNLDLDYNMFLVRRHLSDQEHPSISQSRRVA